MIELIISTITYFGPQYSHTPSDVQTVQPAAEGIQKTPQSPQNLNPTDYATWTSPHLQG